MNTRFTTSQGKNITLRHVEPGDAEGMRDLVAHHEVHRNLLQLPLQSVALWESRLQHAANDSIRLVACHESTIVGWLALGRSQELRRRHCWGLGLAVSPNYHRQGIATAMLSAVLEMADHWLGARRIELGVFCDNTSAQALYERFGFVIESRRSQYAWRDGELADTFLMARLTPRETSCPTL